MIFPYQPKYGSNELILTENIVYLIQNAFMTNAEVLLYFKKHNIKLDYIHVEDDYFVFVYVP